MKLEEQVAQTLREAAVGAASRAYAPYSGYRVGASVMTSTGELFAGCNVENASYSLTICAERNAIFQAVSAGHREIVAVVVYLPVGEPAPPCGACRQVMSELAPRATVASYSGNGASAEWTVPDLLPHAFRLDS